MRPPAPSAAAAFSPWARSWLWIESSSSSFYLLRFPPSEANIYQKGCPVSNAPLSIHCHRSESDVKWLCFGCFCRPALVIGLSFKTTGLMVSKPKAASGDEELAVDEFDSTEVFRDTSSSDKDDPERTHACMAHAKCTLTSNVLLPPVVAFHASRIDCWRGKYHLGRRMDGWFSLPPLIVSRGNNRLLSTARKRRPRRERRGGGEASFCLTSMAVRDEHRRHDNVLFTEEIPQAHLLFSISYVTLAGDFVIVRPALVGVWCDFLFALRCLPQGGVRWPPKWKKECNCVVYNTMIFSWRDNGVRKPEALVGSGGEWGTSRLAAAYKQG